MLAIGQYIHHLLHFHQEVGLPGIGVFSKQRLPAEFDPATNSYNPPSFSYSLSPRVSEDQHLLQYICQKHHLTPDEAQREMDYTVSTMLTILKDKGKVELAPIGDLKRLDNTLALMAMKDSGGLGSVEDQAENAASIPQEVEQKEPVGEPSVNDANFVPNDEPKEKKKMGWIWPAAALLVIAAVLFFLWNTYQDSMGLSKQAQPMDLHTNGTVDTARQPSQALSATDTLNQDSISADQKPINTDDSIQSKQPSVQEEEIPLIQKASEMKYYSIVVASFKDMRLAIKQAKYFRTIGIEAFVLESRMPKNRKKICYGQYPTREAALKDLQRVREEVNPEAYVYP